MGGLEDGIAALVVDVCARSDANSAHLCGEHIGDVVAVEVEGGDNRVVLRLEQGVLQEGVADQVIDHELAGCDFLAELPLCELITPLLEAAFGELHNIALMHEGHGLPAVVEGIAAGGPDEPLAALAGHRLHAET